MQLGVIESRKENLASILSTLRESQRALSATCNQIAARSHRISVHSSMRESDLISGFLQ